MSGGPDASVIPPKIAAEIRDRLRAAEVEHEVRVLLAVESGSRAWGFASPDSDYDARFVFVHHPDWYLSIAAQDRRDVIEYPIVDDIDINGWDLRKALRLFWRSNPAFVEWIQSPLVYQEHGPFAAGSRSLLSTVYSLDAGVQHYRSMAKSNFREYLRAERVPLKKYLYVLRPLLAVRWIERTQTPAPIEFERLTELVRDDRRLHAEIEALLALKRQRPEMGLADRIEVLNEFIECELDRLEATSAVSGARSETLPPLDALFRDCLRDAWAR